MHSLALKFDRCLAAGPAEQPRFRKIQTTNVRKPLVAALPEATPISNSGRREFKRTGYINYAASA